MSVNLDSTQVEENISLKDVEVLRKLVQTSFSLSEQLMDLRANGSKLAKMPSELQPLVARQLLVSLMESIVVLNELGQAPTCQALETDNHELVNNYDLDHIPTLLRKLATSLDDNSVNDSFIC